MTIRDAAVTDIVPKMTQLEGYGETGNPRMIYNLGHAVFEFIETKFGREGVRNFLFALRKSVIGGGDDAYDEAFQMNPDEFDPAFERYLKDRFKAFRDKERPGRLRARPRRRSRTTHFTQALSIARRRRAISSPSSPATSKEGEIDIVLVSAKDGSVVKNLTTGFDKDLGFDHIVLLGERFNTVPWMSWSPDGDRLAYFVRTEKERALVIQNVVTQPRLETRIPHEVG